MRFSCNVRKKRNRKHLRISKKDFEWSERGFISLQLLLRLSNNGIKEQLRFLHHIYEFLVEWAWNSFWRRTIYPKLWFPLIGISWGYSILGTISSVAIVIDPSILTWFVLFPVLLDSCNVCTLLSVLSDLWWLSQCSWSIFTTKRFSWSSGFLFRVSVTRTRHIYSEVYIAGRVFLWEKFSRCTAVFERSTDIV